MQQWKLASFDLDGTLITGTSSAEHLSEKMGNLAQVRKYEEKYSRGEISSKEFGEFDAARYQGYSKSEIYRHLEDVPLIKHVSETVEYFGSLKIPCVISTMAWDCIGEFVATRYGFIDWSGPSLEMDDDKFTGNVDTYFHETEKVTFIEGICLKRDILMSEVVHVGDSRSDFPLFEAAGHSIAFNGCEEACRLAAVSLRSNSLLDVINVVPNLLQKH